HLPGASPFPPQRHAFPPTSPAKIRMKKAQWKPNLRFQWKLRDIGVSHHDTPLPVDNFRNFNGNRTSDFH
ncbi:hypothetical protein ACWEV3_36925, partial [Saccharopolyspora sp. NPDC003752]